MRTLLLAVVLLGCGGDKKQPADGKPGDGSGSSDSGSNADADLSCAGVSTTVPALHGQLVVTGLNQPLYVAQPPGSTDLYVVEKPGTIRIVRSGAALSTAFLDVT